MPLYRKRNIHHVLVSIEFDDLRTYSERMEVQLQHQFDGFNQWIEQQSKGMSDEDKNEFGEHYSDEYHKLSRTNPTFSPCYHNITSNYLPLVLNVNLTVLLK
ncbi:MULTISPECIES: hypothetical protein [unclassified Paenibacillus]|uniref:hypothetical protein n=1 Tax=unclassified Paenibacillus TaxID=185978 RepID=UPI0030EF7968